MSKMSSVEKELTKWRKSKSSYRGKKTPDYIRKQAIELLSEYSPYEIQKRLGITLNTLKNWQEENITEPVFITLPSEPDRKEIVSGEMSSLALKISNGNWSLEGMLSLKDWHHAIRLLEGVR